MAVEGIGNILVQQPKASNPVLKIDNQGRTFMDKNDDGIWQSGEKFLNPAEAVKGGTFSHSKVDVKV
jgi:hypothetical protein